jgi:hypothetical protein
MFLEWLVASLMAIMLLGAFCTTCRINFVAVIVDLVLSLVVAENLEDVEVAISNPSFKGSRFTFPIANIVRPQAVPTKLCAALASHMQAAVNFLNSDPTLRAPLYFSCV